MIRTLASRAAPLFALILLSSYAAVHAQTPPPPPPSPPPGGWDTPPRVVDPRLRQRDAKMKTPMRVRYPDAEACMRISGTTTLVVTIGAEGDVLDVGIEHSSRNRNLDRAAFAAARETRWTPEIFNGQATPSRARIPVDFVLPEVSSESCRRVSVALVDAQGAAQLTPPPVGQPLRAKIGLYVPAKLELRLALRRADPKASDNPDLYPVVHEESRSLEPPAGAELSSLDYATPQPLSAGPYLFEVRVDGELRSSTAIEVR